VQTVPGIGTGITAGIPDYPWWFGVDSEYALQGYMMVGQTDAVYSTIKLLDSMSEVVNGNGKIIHEMSTNGAVFNDGNINETPQFASLIWEIFKWNGDLEFLKNYFPTIKKGLAWLQTQDTDGNLFPEGFGMMEIHGLDSEMIDVATYSQKAFADASKMAKILDEKDLAEEYAEIADKLKKKINEEFWSEEFNSYADFIGTDKQAIRLIDDAIVRADTLEKPWAVEELKETKTKILGNPSEGTRPFVVHHNWVVNTPLEMNIAEPKKAIKALNTAEKYRNPFGVFVTGIDRDEVEQTEEGSFKGGEVFTYTGAVMTLPTAVQIIAENNYGRPEKALNYLERMTRSFSFAFPGSMYEVSPDYGMISQAWNIYGYAVPIVNQFFGIQPEAINKKIVIQPKMPRAWNKASLENVEVGENEVSAYYSKLEGVLDIEVTQVKNWELELVLTDMAASEYEFSPKNAKVSTENGNLIIRGASDKLKISVKTD
jgi:glycogen debranching enzyme